MVGISISWRIFGKRPVWVIFSSPLRSQYAFVGIFTFRHLATPSHLWRLLLVSWR